MPLEQYDSQLSSPLWDNLYSSLIPQVKYDLWYQLRHRLQYELGEETHKYVLMEDLEDKCR